MRSQEGHGISFGGRNLHAVRGPGIIGIALVLLILPAISHSAPPGLQGAKTEKTSSAAKDDLKQLPSLEQFIRDGKLREVETLLRTYVKEHPESARAYYDLGYVCFRTHQLSASIEALAKSLQLDVSNAEAHKILGLNLTMIGRFDEAQLEMEQAVRLKPDSAEIHYFLGRIHYTRNTFPLAKREFEEAIRLDPSYMKAYDNLGLTMEGLGDDKAALANYQKAIALMKQQGMKSEWPYINVCAMYNRLKNPAQALEYCQKATEVNPRSAQAFFETARAHMERQNWDAAARALQSAIENNPRFPRYHYVLGTVYRKIGKRAESQKEMETFQTLSAQVAAETPQGTKGRARGTGGEPPDLRE